MHDLLPPRARLPEASTQSILLVICDTTSCGAPSDRHLHRYGAGAWHHLILKDGHVGGFCQSTAFSVVLNSRRQPAQLHIVEVQGNVPIEHLELGVH